MKANLILPFTFLILCLFISCESDDPSNGSLIQQKQDQTLFQLIQSNKNLNQFELFASKYESITNFLKDTSDYLTVFAFSDEAYDKLNLQLINSGNFDSLSDKEIEQILLYHISSKYVLKTTDLEIGLEIATESKDEFNKNRIILVNENRNLQGGTNGLEVKFSSQNLKANNGILHIIDQVLVPFEYSINPDSAQFYPSIYLVESDSLIADGDTLDYLQKFSLTFLASKGKYPLNTWAFYKDDKIWSNGTVLDQDEFVLRINNIGSNSVEDSAFFKITVSDINNHESSLHFRVYYLDPYRLIEINEVTIGAQSNTSFGNFYNVKMNSVFDYNTASSNSGANVDFFYYWENADYSILSTLGNVSGFYNNEITNWTNKKNAKFLRTNLFYDNLTTTEINNLNPTSSGSGVFIKDQEIIFYIENETKGVMTITEFVGGETGYFKFNMKYIKLN